MQSVAPDFSQSSGRCSAQPLAEEHALALQAPCSDQEYAIFILAPTANDGRLTAEFLFRAGPIARLCHDSTHLCAEIEQGCGAVLLAEEALDQRAINAISETLARQPS